MYIFERPLTVPFQIFKEFCKIFKKTKKFLLTGCLQIFSKNFLAKLVQSVYMFPFLKAKNDKKNLTTESGSKKRFRLLQEKVVIQAVSIKARF